MIDTHTHIYASEFDIDRDDVVARARAVGVTRMLLPNEGLDSLLRLHDTRLRYPDCVSLAIGLHPEEVRHDWTHVLSRLETQLDEHPYVAVGEVGLDLYWDRTYRNEQMEVLDTQLRWCVSRGLPAIIHCREALNELLDVFDNFGAVLPPLVMHCFSGTVSDVERLRQRTDCYFGIGGVVTFKNSKLGEVLPAIGLERIVLETDAPYLAPVPHRGHRNEPAFLPQVRDAVARHLGSSPQEVEQATDDNARRLFQNLFN